ncbi:MAG TPA: glucoamylase family protein [Pedobacter sp.]
MMKLRFCTLAVILIFLACKKGGNEVPAEPSSFKQTAVTINNQAAVAGNFNNIPASPVVRITFSSDISNANLANAISFTDVSTASNVAFTAVVENGNTVVVQPTASLSGFKVYKVDVSTTLKSVTGGTLGTPVTVTFNTGFDSSNKFPVISDEELLTTVQRQTFKYFYDFGHPVSGMARERNTSGNLVTSGGTGFGVMALITGISRNFITRKEGLDRVNKIVAFLITAERFHGAYPHWMDGTTGKVIPFSAKDDGGDLVETSLLVQGLLSARQYFNGTLADETTLRNNITKIYNDVEWDWYRKDGGSVLLWHWSPTYNWDMNLPVRGWHEALITYVLAASSPTHPIPKSVYDNGWAQNGAIRNGSTYYGVQLPLGEPNGGPLFLSHYSFLGINPIGLTDAYANYETQTKAHTQINYNYCLVNPKNYYGYSENCWGLTASDIQNGYSASSPTNDRGVIAPTAAISSIPYTPENSLKALRFFYYKLGDKLFKEYGFIDAFSLQDQWFATSTLAIDQGPIIIMIENYRSKLLWNLFMSAPEVKAGMKNLGFNSPNL